VTVRQWFKCNQGKWSAFSLWQSDKDSNTSEESDIFKLNWFEESHSRNASRVNHWNWETRPHRQDQSDSQIAPYIPNSRKAGTDCFSFRFFQISLEHHMIKRDIHSM
jgi:hypothetical protein